MPLNIIDFTKRDYGKDDYSEISNILPNILKGYLTSKGPEIYQNEQNKIKSETRLHGFDALLKEEQAKMLSKDPYYREDVIRSDMQLKEAQRKQALANALLHEEQAKNPNRQTLTPKQKEIADIYGYGTKEYNDAMKRSLGITENGEIPKGAVTENSLSPGIRQIREKQRETEQEKATAMVEAHQTLDKMEDLIKKNPGMAKYLEQLIDPENKDSIKNILLDRRLDEHKKSVIQMFDKLSSDLQLAQGKTFGSKIYTDFTKKLIAKSKPGSGMTDEALLSIIGRLKEKNEPGYKYLDDIYKSYEGRYYLPPNYYYSETKKNIETQDKKIKIYNDETGEIKEVTEDEARKLGAIK